MLGVDRTTIAKWETRGESRESALKRGADRVGIDHAWFLDCENSEPRFVRHVANVRATNRPDQMGEPAGSLRRGDQVMLAVWRGVMAGDGDCEFWLSAHPRFSMSPPS